MEKAFFDRYKKNLKELSALDRDIERLDARLEDLPEVSGKVTKSSDDFPYIEEHLTVRMAEPKEAKKIKDRIWSKEQRRKVVQAEVDAVEQFIEKLPEGVDKQILEMVYLDGMTQQSVADDLGYTKGRISQMISKAIKD